MTYMTCTDSVNVWFATEKGSIKRRHTLEPGDPGKPGEPAVPTGPC